MMIDRKRGARAIAPHIWCRAEIPELLGGVPFPMFMAAVVEGVRHPNVWFRQQSNIAVQKAAMHPRSQYSPHAASGMPFPILDPITPDAWTQAQAAARSRDRVVPRSHLTLTNGLGLTPSAHAFPEHWHGPVVSARMAAIYIR